MDGAKRRFIAAIEIRHALSDAAARDAAPAFQPGRLRIAAFDRRTSSSIVPGALASRLFTTTCLLRRTPSRKPNGPHNKIARVDLSVDGKPD